MAFKFPFTNYHELNLTWVLEQLKKLFEESADNVETIQTYNGRLTAVEAELPVVAENAAAASQESSAAASIAQTASNKADTAQENALQASAQAGQARQEATAATAAAAGASQAAEQAQATALNFDGRITQAEDDAAAALSASRSFEERVNAATNTANNAAQTATTAQGIATNANQNAAAALDKIGDLSDLDTTNKNNLVAAINEALENGGAVDSVNGKTGVVVLDASDIGYDSGTVAGELGTLKTALSDLGGSLAPVEETATASQSYAVNDLLVYNNQLYKVVSVIAAGGTLTPGTNITETTIDAELENAGGSGGASVVVPFPLANYFPETLKTITVNGRTINVLGNHFTKIRRYGSSEKVAYSIISGTFYVGSTDEAISTSLIDADFITINSPYLYIKAWLMPGADTNTDRGSIRIYTKNTAGEITSRTISLATPTYFTIESGMQYAIIFFTGSSNGPTEFYLFFDTAAQLPA